MDDVNPTISMKIEYKRSNGANQMSLSKPIMINEKTICVFKSTGKKSSSTFHGVTFNFDKKNLGGVLDSEIVKVWEQVEQDYNTGLIVAGTMGVELEGGKRHLHISLILSERALTVVTGDRYRSLINVNRLCWRSYGRAGKGVKSCTTVVASQPTGLKGGVRHSAYNWLAYSLKEMAKDFNDVNVFANDVDFTNSNDFKTIGMFDGSGHDERSKAKMASCIFIAWQKKCSEKNGEPENICIGSRLPTQAMEFMESVGIDDVEWTVEGDRKAMAMNQASIITKMVLNRIGKKRYKLDPNFLGSTKEGKAAYAFVMGLKPPPNRTSQDYENELYGALLKKRASDLRVHVHVESKVEKRLMLELEKLKKQYLKLENVCKGQLVTIDKLRGDMHSRIRNRKIRDLTRKITQEEKEPSLHVSCGDYVRWTDELNALKAERDKDELMLLSQTTQQEEEETEEPGRKRQRVVEVIPKKNPDHLRQDMLLAERARIHREAEE